MLCILRRLISLTLQEKAEMRQVGCYLVLLLVECFGGVTLSLTCPEMTEETTSCESVQSWLCGYLEWSTSMKEWKDNMEQDCSEEELGAEWQDLFSCSENDATVQCKNQSAKYCENDDLECTVCYCTDGKYTNRQNHFALWRKRQVRWQKTLKFYNEKLKNCGGESDECSSGEEKTESTETPSTKPEMATAAPTEAEATTAVANEPEMTTSEHCEAISYGDKCYVIVEPNARLNKSQSIDLCVQNGMKLADILSAEHFNLTMSYVVPKLPTYDGSIYLWVANTFDFSRPAMIITSEGDAFEMPQWYFNGPPTNPNRTSLQIIVDGTPNNGGFFAFEPSVLYGPPLCVKC